jgi:hypothetical protein
MSMVGACMFASRCYKSKAKGWCLSWSVDFCMDKDVKKKYSILEHVPVFLKK